MNVASNLGSALVSGDILTAVMGNSSLSSGTVAGNLTESPFQQLISQALAGGGLTGQTTGINGAGSKTENTQGSMNDLIQNMLFSEGLNGKGNLTFDANTISKLLDQYTSQEKTKKSEETSGLQASDSLQEIMLELVNQSPFATSEKSSDGFGAFQDLMMPMSAYSGTISNAFMTQTKSGDKQSSISLTGLSGLAGLSGINGLSELTELTGLTGFGTSKDSGSIAQIMSKALTDKMDAQISKTVNQAKVSAEFDEFKAGTYIPGEDGKTINQDGSKTQDVLKAFDNTEKQGSNLSQNKEISGSQLFADASDVKKIQIENEQQAGNAVNQTLVQGMSNVSEVSGQIVTTQNVDGAEAYSQISKEVLSNLEQNGPKEFKMQLEPENLGPIDIKLRLNDGKLVIDIMAASSSTQALLTSQVDKLISNIGLQNVQVESVTVGQQMDSQSQNSQNHGFSMNSGMNFSQRRQQNQENGFEFSNLNNQNSENLEEAGSIEGSSNIKNLSQDIYRMNYSV